MPSTALSRAIREPNLERPYRAWGYPVTPLLFVALSIWMIRHSIVERPASSIAGVATIAGSLALFAMIARRGATERAALPELKGDP